MIEEGGRWLLYQSNTSGQAEIYVRRYPALDRQWQISEGGGVQARWGRNSKEIYYRSERQIVAVPIDASGAEPAFGTPTALFADDYDFGQGITIANFDVIPDGHFIMLRRGANGGKLRVVVNWTEELKQILRPVACAEPPGTKRRRARADSMAVVRRTLGGWLHTGRDVWSRLGLRNPEAPSPSNLVSEPLTMPPVRHSARRQRSGRRRHRSYAES